MSTLSLKIHDLHLEEARKILPWVSGLPSESPGSCNRCSCVRKQMGRGEERVGSALASGRILLCTVGHFLQEVCTFGSPDLICGGLQLPPPTIHLAWPGDPRVALGCSPLICLWLMLDKESFQEPGSCRPPSQRVYTHVPFVSSFRGFSVSQSRCGTPGEGSQA